MIKNRLNSILILTQRAAVCFTLAVCVLISMQPATAATISAELEWEAQEDVSNYEIELTHEKTQKKIAQKVQGTSIKLLLEPGMYKMRMRALDDRGVPGDWSEDAEVFAQPPAISKLKPANNEKIKTAEAEEFKVDFAWEPAADAENYEITVKDKDNQILIKTSVSQPIHSMSLKVASNYSWTVRAIYQGGLSKASSEFKFELIGKKIDMPLIDAPENDYVRDLKWSKPNNTESYKFRLFKKDKGGNWKQVVQKNNFRSNAMKFPPKSPGGEYALEIAATGEGYEDSDYARSEFRVHDGDRSPAAEKANALRDSIEKPKNLYAIASYFITTMTYSSVMRETASQSKFNAMGGTGRVGLGYFKPTAKFGYFGFGEFSGFNIGSQNFTFAASELHVAYKKYFGFTQLRASAGLFYKELPETKTEAGSSSYSVNTIASIGPHLGVDIWRPFSTKLGLQFNTRFYYSHMKMKTPNGRDIEPTPSYQFGFLGTYRFSSDFMGFAGYAYRHDEMAYKATAGTDDTSSNSLATDGEINKVTIDGHYLNLILEYSF